MEEFEYDTQLGEVVVVNQSGLPDDEVISAVRARQAGSSGLVTLGIF